MEIKHLCLIYKITYNELAKKLGVPYSTMRQWYNQERRTPNYIKKYALLYLRMREIINE